ncbi:uncharacterized protein LOC108742777 [Agrilus planipennis]|uniref:Uncharacterized protein LOC108742777 n=1 Tax=Agrilus planipennis TaxID=224129 RepID=A0A1W4XLE1_AGRPL|nr:uncharacterized protein LOC108742777 [Agrilus planipennis]
MTSLPKILPKLLPKKPLNEVKVWEPEPPPQSEPTVITLRQCFTTIVDRKPLHVSMSSLRHILATDLNVNILTLQVGMDNVLAEALAHYMKLWPGWSRSSEYFTGQLLFKKWFEKFRQYLMYKLNYIIMKSQSLGLVDNDVEIVEPKEKKDSLDAGVQTDPVVYNINQQENKPDSPYKLSISGPPYILNTLVFVKQGNDILIKQHSERPWTDLTVKQLMNWPHVGIEIKLPDLSISRKNNLEYKRYVGLHSDIKNVPPLNTTTEVKEVKGCSFAVFSFEFIQTYISQFLEIVKKCPKVKSDRIEMLEHLFADYLNDVKEANVYKNTVCTYTNVSYHIGKSIYFRNKRIMSTVGNKNEIVNFYEFFAPKVEYGMQYFKAVSDVQKTGTNFRSLNRLKTSIAENQLKELEEFVFIINNTCITFLCILCKKSHSGPYAKQSLLNHFKQEHKLEQSVLCFKCRRQHDVLTLSADRWKHQCIHP